MVVLMHAYPKCFIIYIYNNSTLFETRFYAETLASIKMRFF